MLEFWLTGQKSEPIRLKNWDWRFKLNLFKRKVVYGDVCALFRCCICLSFFPSSVFLSFCFSHKDVFALFHCCVCLYFYCSSVFLSFCFSQIFFVQCSQHKICKNLGHILRKRRIYKKIYNCDFNLTLDVTQQFT